MSNSKRSKFNNAHLLWQSNSRVILYELGIAESQSYWTLFVLKRLQSRNHFVTVNLNKLMVKRKTPQVGIEHWGKFELIDSISSSEANLSSMVKVLMRHHANPCQQNATGFTSLHSAAKRGNVDIMQALLQGDVSDINIANCKGKTPLMVAVEENKVQIIRYLILRKIYGNIMPRAG